HIYHISSMPSLISSPYEGYYAAAKTALRAYSQALRHEVKSFGMKVSVVEPGFFRTKLGETRHTSEERITDYDQMRDRAVKALEEDIEKGGDPRTVAEKILRIVESRSPRLEYLVGKSGRYRSMMLVLPESSF